MNNQIDNLERFEDIIHLSDYLKENGYEVIYESEKLNQNDLDSPVCHYLYVDNDELIVKSQPNNNESNDHIFEIDMSSDFNYDYVIDTISVLKKYLNERNNFPIELEPIAGTPDYVEPIDVYEAQQRMENIEQEFDDLEAALQTRKYIGFKYTFFY